MQLIDTHVHINFDVFESDLEDIKNRWQEAEVVHLVHSCVEPKEFPSIKALADRFGNLSFAVGLHPLDADKWTGNMGKEILDYAKSDHRVVAIGEMGLDFYKASNQKKTTRSSRSTTENCSPTAKTSYYSLSRCGPKTKRCFRIILAGDR